MLVYWREALGGAALFVLMMWYLGARRGGSGVPWLTRPRNRPAVYILRSLRDPQRIKVGYTARKVETRAAEIAAKHGPVEILFSLRMPHAYTAEQTAHRTLRGKWGVRNLGGEWYRGNPESIRRTVLASARKTRRSAKLRLSWPKGGELFVWKDF